MKRPSSLLAAAVAVISGLIMTSASDAWAGGLTGRLCESLTQAGGCINPITDGELYFLVRDPVTFQIVGYAGTTTLNSAGSFGKTLPDGVYQVGVNYWIGNNYYQKYAANAVTVNGGYTNIYNVVPWSY